MEALGERQQALLGQLIKTKQGLTIEDLARKLAITRTAVRQHVSALEGSGYVERGALQNTGGRPGQAYRLSNKGYDLFPKQYSWFSEVLLDAVRKENGSQGLEALLTRMGNAVADSLEPQLKGLSPEERIKKTSALMNELAYEAEALKDRQSGDLPAIEATNCVYHSLAMRYPEVCSFDLALLARMTRTQVSHEKCMVRGAGACRFKFTPTPRQKH